MNGFRALLTACGLTLVLVTPAASLGKSPAIDFDRDVRPVLSKYCAGCHRDDDGEGEFSVETFADLMRGGEHGSAIVPGKSQESRLWQLVSGAADPKMPPAEEPQPSDEQRALLQAWIDAGAPGPAKSEADDPSVSPSSAARRTRPSLAPKPITAMAWNHDGQWLAVGRFGHVDLLTADGLFIDRLDGMPGKVTCIAFSPQGEKLLVATGNVGVDGEAWVWDLQSREKSLVLKGHRDILYSAKFSASGRRIATTGYDRKIRIWDAASGELLKTLEGHHGAVFDLDFSSDDTLIASASADATIKVWQVETGIRLDTLSQPLKEQLTVDISPDGNSIVAAGADNRLRLWKLVSRTNPEINPLQFARYAHEQPVQQVRFSPDGRWIVSLSADRTLKVWDATQLTLVETFNQDLDVAQVFAIQPDGKGVVVGRMDGGLQRYSLPADAKEQGDPAVASSVDAAGAVSANASPAVESSAIRDLQEMPESEPNDGIDDAPKLVLPAAVTGTIHRAVGPGVDVDSYRFSARQGELWLIEVQAARNGSPLDSMVRVLDADGRPVTRVVLQAIRDSYFTFRGKDSMQTGDFRLQNWEEMRLNQYLYAAGEVVKLYHYPRGPDSGFNVYPNSGSRHTYFDTTAVSHALNEPAYIVEPHAPHETLPVNGLPVFPVYFENDDESQRRWGADSLLHFTAPEDGEYVVQIQDVRQSQGEAYRYRLLVRPPKPDFVAKLTTSELKVPHGAGQAFSIEVERLDGFDGPIEIELAPPAKGWRVTSPLVIEPGHLRASGTVFAPADLPLPNGGETPTWTIAVSATADLGGERVHRDIGTLGPIQLVPPPPVTIEIVGNTGQFTDDGLPIIEIERGTTGVFRAKIQRGDFKERVSFGGEDALFNVPHGVFVANIGLNGVLITEAESERDVYVRAEPWVKSGEERLVFIRAEVNGNPTSAPALLRIR